MLVKHLARHIGRTMKQRHHSCRSVWALTLLVGSLLVPAGCGFIGYPVTHATECDTRLVLLGNATRGAACNTVQLHPPAPAIFQQGGVVWPDLAATGDLHLRFTITISDADPVPGDGFAVVFGDPALGATISSLGYAGGGLGAQSIPGVVLFLDDYRSQGEPPVPYFGITRGEAKLWENPFLYSNSNIPVIAQAGLTISHQYVVTVLNGTMNVTMDGAQIFSGAVALPPLSYVYVTAGDGLDRQRTVVSDLDLTFYPTS